MARSSQHPDEAMEDATKFDLNDAVRRWREEFGTTSSLSTVDLDELEFHLRDHVSSLNAGGLPLDAAFESALKQLGDRDCVAGEFAKVNPQRIWMERGKWMLAGIIVLHVLHPLSLLPVNVVANFGWSAQRFPYLVEAIARLAQFSVFAAGALLCWRLLTRKLKWGEDLVKACLSHPVAACIGLIVAMQGAEWLSREASSQILDWMPSPAGASLPYDTELLLRLQICGVAIENTLFALVLCLVAKRVMRAHDDHSDLQSRRNPAEAIHRMWLARALWMLVGMTAMKFVGENLMAYSSLPSALISAHYANTAVPQHLL